MKSQVFVLALVIVSLSLSSGFPCQGAKASEFDYLILAQFWPPSSCIYFEEREEECDIPPKVKGWTIHGLWPSIPESEYPQYCNDSMTFDFSQIKSLGSQLDLHWHYYKKGADPKTLWNHEWTKHGTCAYSLPALRGEMLFFNKTLQLHSHINLTRVLEDAGIVPSTTKFYNMKQLNEAVKKAYKFEPVIVCDYDKKNKNTYLDQIYLCYNKSFSMQDCSNPSVQIPPWRRQSRVSYYSNCEEKDQIRYLPRGAVPLAGRTDSISNSKADSKVDSRLLFQSEVARGND